MLINVVASSWLVISRRERKKKRMIDSCTVVRCRHGPLLGWDQGMQFVAQEVGGALVILWGNHEMENGTGAFVHTKDCKSDFDGVYGPILDRVLPSDWRVGYGTSHKPVRWSMFEPGGFLLEPLLSNLKVVVKVGKTVLVHGGLDLEHLTMMVSKD
jgi:hypothetical protein